MIHRFRPLSLLIVAWGLFSTSVSAQLSVKDTLWGFDGKKIPSRFNLFSASVTNIGASPYDGSIALSSDSGNSQSQPIYLASGQERLVQFVFFVENSYDFYSLSWKGGSTRIAQISGESTEGPPATVVLVSESILTKKVSDVRPFPESRFPTTVAGTSNLHTAILDHNPRWDSARRTAFVDWIRGGGIAVIGREVGGGFPNFTGELADLNPRSVPGEPFHLGSGLVFHLDSSANSISKSLLVKAGIRPVENFNHDGGYSAESTIASHLGAITNPEISWGLIFFVAFIYVLVVGPIHFIWGRRQKRAVVSIGAFLGAVALFSWLFTVIGRRGYGESTRVYSLSIANDIGDGNYDVTQWSSVFVTSGDTYRLFHPNAESSHYARASRGESFTRFTVTSGKNGAIEAEIPLFSHSNFVHRAKLPGFSIQPSVVTWESKDGRFSRLELSLPEKFPAIADAWVRHQGKFYNLNRNASKLVLSAGSPTSERAFLSYQNVWRMNNGTDFDYDSSRYGRVRESRSDRENRAFGSVRHLLIGMATAGSAELSASFERPHETSPDRADLFIYTESPDSFYLGEPFAGTERGKTLYRTTIYAPVLPDAQGN